MLSLINFLMLGGTVAIVQWQGIVEAKGILRIPLPLQSCQSRQLITAINALNRLIAAGIVDIDSVALESGSLEPAGTKLLSHLLAGVPNAVRIRVVGMNTDLTVGESMSARVIEQHCTSF
jgi:hypothetical protein